ncbi:MAG: ImmA/IrrE family metallo-endopeptidase, partial [Thermodesulfovibrionales bacterium]|nr:ImmA/IrrE family metallo-endopeptidase [Thermodesulfovibrionales bacterium]
LIRGYKLTIPIDLLELARLLKIRIHFRQLPANCDGFVVSLRDSFPNVEHLILVNSHKPKTRQRFTIAHEIGHVVLRHYEEEDILLDKHLKSPQESNFKRETAADVFASELLIPTPHLLRLVKRIGANRVDVNNEKAMKHLCAFYQVSKHAMQIKIEKVKKILGKEALKQTL